MIGIKRGEWAPLDRVPEWYVDFFAVALSGWEHLFGGIYHVRFPKRCDYRPVPIVRAC